jgi:hypothetical protein
MLRWRNRAYPNAIESPTYNATQNPVQDADNKNDLVLSARKIAKENVHQRNRAEHHSQTKPPENPSVNPNM